MKFTIDRTKWYRGNSVGSKLLRAEDCKQCCVGQMCSQLGVNDLDLLGITSVWRLLERNELGLLPITAKENMKPLLSDGVEARWVEEAYSINDRDDLCDTEREHLLIELLRRNGHELEFVN
jgi:hypothetical protein